MKLKTIAFVTLLVCVVAAWHKVTAKPSAVEQLLERPRSFPTGSVGGFQHISAPSASLPATRQNGRINVFTFYSDSCPGSQRLGGYIGHLARMRPDVAFQMVNVGPPGLRDSSAHTDTPHVIIYSADGALLASDSDGGKDGLKLLCDWMNRQVEARGAPVST